MIVRCKNAENNYCNANSIISLAITALRIYNSKNTLIQILPTNQ
jgi:hypothetical protein